MEEKKSFLERISAVQMELKAPKGQFNEFGNFRFRSCEDILEAAKPICSKNRLLLLLSDKPLMIGNWHYIESTATFYDLDSDKTFCATASAREAESKPKMDASQLTGTASSYARKYALNGLLNIDDTKDADTNENHMQTNFAKPQQKQQAQHYYCSECKKLIQPVKFNNGVTWSVEDTVNYGTQNYGKILCASCLQKAQAK